MILILETVSWERHSVPHLPSVTNQLYIELVGAFPVFQGWVGKRGSHQRYRGIFCSSCKRYWWWRTKKCDKGGEGYIARVASLSYDKVTPRHNIPPSARLALSMRKEQGICPNIHNMVRLLMASDPAISWVCYTGVHSVAQ